MEHALAVARQVASSEATVLLHGESGTGKGVIARFIHDHSPRGGSSFVTVHCPSLSRELLESELFGHVRGAFTGAVQSTEGKVAAAEGGTLFLDEIGDLPLTIQPKLLRLLQERLYERVGETRTRKADVRLLAATNRDLPAEVAAGRFREDLYYRLNVIEIELPTLRQRPRDILPIAEHLLQFFARQAGKTLTGFTEAAREAIARHSWPGNLRELRNAIERGVILSPGPEVDLVHLPVRVIATGSTRLEIGGHYTLEAVEIEHVRRVLASTTSLDEAATVLGINPSTLYRKRNKYCL
jgi:NtrC-family two-component system response regulator AlgB